MSKNPETIAAVATKARALMESRAALKIEAEAWVDRKVAEYQKELELAVAAALDDGHSVANVARAYTVSGAQTPNRNAIYEIRSKYKDQPVINVDYPFEWVPRSVRTAAGNKEVFDVHAVLSDFGPLDVSGEFTWRFDTNTGSLDEVLDSVEDPYPVSNKYYRQVLDRWLTNNPYPGVA